MTQWYVKDLSKLTQVSVQTLHHYDRIGLLEPSIRLPNGYRLYSEKDLLKLQQIIALKYFGFELSQIKTLLAGKVDVIDHFSVQSQFLEEKAKTLLEASHTLKSILSDCERDKSIPWETIIKLIEVYRMTQQLENSWAKKALNPEEFKDYVNFSQSLQTRFTPAEAKAAEKEWANIVKEINANVDKDPNGKVGIELGRRCMTWVNNLYSKEHASLRKVVWEKGFKKGQMGDEHGLTRASIAWLDQAMKAYYIDRILSILKKVETHPHDEVLTLWNEFIIEKYGDLNAPKDDLIEMLLNNDKISQAAKNWLKQVS